MPKWLQAFRQTTTYLGVVVIAIIWGGIYLLASEQHERAYQDAVRQGSNLTRVLEEYVRRVVQQSDQSLLALRRAYEQDPEHFDIEAWVARAQSTQRSHVSIRRCRRERVTEGLEPWAGYSPPSCRRP